MGLSARASSSKSNRLNPRHTRAFAVTSLSLTLRNEVCLGCVHAQADSLGPGLSDARRV